MNHATRVDIGRRKAHRDGGINEDSVAAMVFDESHRDSVRQSTGVFVLADGVGGTSGGDVASYLATTVVPEELSSVALRLARAENPVFDDLEMDTDGFPSRPDTSEIRAAISDAVATADEEIRERRRGQGSATTIVVGVYEPGRLHVGWVGDSPAYVINRGDRRIEQVTRDHSAVAYYVAEGRSPPRWREFTRTSPPSRAPSAEATPTWSSRASRSSATTSCCSPATASSTPTIAPANSIRSTSAPTTRRPSRRRSESTS
ncbi:PP2C family protein-serine/threonine phosphatase [Halobellus rufus]|uniref:PP2C family protein-serine/threonine phosphatase n=1 Tax=Halobellus rufus TaxID=1448860 RepID=UPI0009DD5822|nr:protein phosphatase 2C domain-containing protein [Halobellus rufus]